MISAPGMASAKRSESPVLPVAVAPARTIRGGKRSSAARAPRDTDAWRAQPGGTPPAEETVRSGVGASPRECVWPGAIDAHVHQLANERCVAVEVYELVVPGSTRNTRRAAVAVVVRRRRPD